MDFSNIIVAAIALLGTLAGSYFSNNKTTALIGYRIQELEKKVDKHNKVVERMGVVERDLETVWKNIDEMREEIHNQETKGRE